MKNTSPRAIEPRSEQVMIHTTKDTKKRLRRIADRRGWSLSKAGHLALEHWLRAMEEQSDDDVQNDPARN